MRTTFKLEPAKKHLKGCDRHVQRRVHRCEMFAIKLARWHVVVPNEKTGGL